MTDIQEVNSRNFSDIVLNSATPVLVDFSTPWCGPCRKLAPVLEQIQSEFSGDIKIVRINADENTEIAKEYGISTVPTLIIIKDKEPKETMTGLVSKSSIISNIKKYV